MSLRQRDSLNPSLQPLTLQARPVLWDRIQTRRGLFVLLLMGAALAVLEAMHGQLILVLGALLLGFFCHVSAAYRMWQQRCFTDWGWRLLSMGGALLVVDSLWRLLLSR